MLYAPLQVKLHYHHVSNVKTVDTYVVVILVGIFHDLAQHHPTMQTWVGFGTGKHFHYYHINSICQEFGEREARTLPFVTPFHVLMQHPSSAVKAQIQPESMEKISGNYAAGFTSASQDGFVLLEFTSAAFRLIERFTFFFTIPRHLMTRPSARSFPIVG